MRQVPWVTSFENEQLSDCVGWHGCVKSAPYPKGRRLWYMMGFLYAMLD